MENKLYCITDGHRFIGDNDVIVKNFKSAARFTDRVDAVNILDKLQNRKNNPISQKFSVVVVNGFELQEENKDQELDEMLRIIKEFKEKIPATNEEVKRLKSELSTVDRSIQDILHVIELTSQNACNGYKLYRKLKELSKQRRSIKNRLFILSHLLGSVDFREFETIERFFTDVTYKSKELLYDEIFINTDGQ